MLHKALVPMTFLGLVAGLALSLSACNGGGEDGDGSGGACVVGMSIACTCPSGEMGAQTCIDGASYGLCECADGTGGDEGGSSSSDDDTGGGDQVGDSSTGGACGNGMEEPGECDDDAENFCPEDCASATGDSESSTGTADCSTEPTYQLMIPNIPSVWEDAGVMGFQAGQNMCQAMGADHVCDYEEVVDAEMKGDFAAIAAGTTAWLHRTTTVDIGGGVMSAPGVGGRCVDWTYSTNHISDGEFVTFGAGGTVTYSFDDDTNYDAMAPGVHTQMGLLECGGVNRAILCCYPECDPEG